jgi:hypothetical protein
MGGTIATNATTSDLMRLRLSAEMISWSDASSFNPCQHSRQMGGSGVVDLPVFADKVFEEEGGSLADGKSHIVRGNEIEQTGQEVGRCLCLDLQCCLRCDTREHAV